MLGIMILRCILNDFVTNFHFSQFKSHVKTHLTGGPGNPYGLLKQSLSPSIDIGFFHVFLF